MIIFNRYLSELSCIALKTTAAAPTQTVTMLRTKLAFKIPFMKTPPNYSGNSIPYSVPI